jgi:hypothetical protein
MLWWVVVVAALCAEAGRYQEWKRVLCVVYFRWDNYYARVV